MNQAPNILKSGATSIFAYILNKVLVKPGFFNFSKKNWRQKKLKSWKNLSIFMQKNPQFSGGFFPFSLQKLSNFCQK